MFKPMLTRQWARKLANLDKNYYPRCIRGEWSVWDAVSEHEVEFDLSTLQATARELESHGGNGLRA